MPKHYSSHPKHRGSSMAEDGGSHHSKMHHDRRMHEMHGAGMISEDHSAVANLPQGVIMKPYGESGSYLPEHLDDTIRGIDHQESMDDNKRREHNVPKKV